MAIKISSTTKIRLANYLQGILLIVLAGLLAWFSTRYTLEHDWTKAGRHSLSKASIAIMEKMDKTLEITAYARDNQQLRDAIKNFITRYKKHKKDIVLRFVNPDAVPDEVRNLGIQVNGELVLRYDGRSEHIRRANEQEFTNAIQRLVKGTQHWLVFLEGHGERNPLGQANHDLSNWARQLNQRGFRLQPLNLGDLRVIPDNTSVLVIAGPSVPLLPGETAIIHDYLDQGGNMLWLHDPGRMQGMEAIAEYLGIGFEPGIIIDLAGQMLGINDPTITLITKSLYNEHPTTNQFTLTTLFPMVASIREQTKADNKNSWNIKPILLTADHTWLEHDAPSGEIGFDENVDKRGPFTIAISLERNIDVAINNENKTRQQRIIITGDGDFLSNRYIANSGNLDLGIRLANWLSRDDDFINIPPRTASDTQLNLSPIVAGVIGIFFIIILPLGLFGTGFTIWWRRRKL